MRSIREYRPNIYIYISIYKQAVELDVKSQLSLSIYPKQAVELDVKSQLSLSIRSKRLSWTLKANYLYLSIYPKQAAGCTYIYRRKGTLAIILMSSLVSKRRGCAACYLMLINMTTAGWDSRQCFGVTKMGEP